MDAEVRVLLIEDNAGDASLLTGQLMRDPLTRWEITHEQQLKDGLLELASRPFDVVLLDLSLPDSAGLDTLTHVLAAAPETPVVVLTGLEDAAVGVEAVRKGAQDYLVKDQISGRALVRAVQYALERKRANEERECLVRRLQEALANIKSLRGLLPICATCKRIRDDDGYWNQVETYIHEHTDANFTHSMCPECQRKLHPEYVDAE